LDAAVRCGRRGAVVARTLHWTASIAWFVAFVALASACVPVPDDAALGSSYVRMWRTSWVVSPGTSERFALQATPFAVGLDLPTAIGHADDGSGRLFVAEQRGMVRVVVGGQIDADPFLDLRDRTSCCGEQGLLGFAVAPRFAEHGHVFVHYTDLAGDVVVARYTATGDGRRADPSSESVVLRVSQPGTTHNGGGIAFGPDGQLYVSLGDGTFSVAPSDAATRTDVLLGKVLRLDVRELPYRIPDDNPFVDVPGARGEIWALGLRNPWRISFDRRTGDLYVGDVGQARWEEIDVVPAGVGGLDFGWPRMEGAACRGMCSDDVGELPVVVYGREDGCAVTGGYVYRGRTLARLQGTYLFGDFCSGRIWGAWRHEGTWERMLVFDTDATISTFGEDEAGELYFADYGMGAIYRIEGSDEDPAAAGH
jgi:glucose/arabinose dehydrogenase